MRRLHAEQPHTPTTLPSEAANSPSGVPTKADGRKDAVRVEGEVVRVFDREGRRGPIFAVAAGFVQRAGNDAASWDKVQRRLGKCSSTSRVTANAIGANQSTEGTWVRVATGGEFPAFGTDGTRSVVAVCGDTGTSTSSGGIELVVVTSEIVGIIGIIVGIDDAGRFVTDLGHRRHIRNIGPVRARATTPIIITVGPCRGIVIDIHTGVEGTDAVVTVCAIIKVAARKRSLR